MTGKDISLTGQMSRVRGEVGFISLTYLTLEACEVYQVLLTRSPLTTKAVWRNYPRSKILHKAPKSPA